MGAAQEEATRIIPPRAAEPVRPAKSFAPDEEMEKYGTRVVPSTPAAAPCRLQTKPLDEEDD